MKDRFIFYTVKKNDLDLFHFCLERIDGDYFELYSSIPRQLLEHVDPMIWQRLLILKPDHLIINKFLESLEKKIIEDEKTLEKILKNYCYPDYLLIEGKIGNVDLSILYGLIRCFNLQPKIFLSPRNHPLRFFILSNKFNEEMAFNRKNFLRIISESPLSKFEKMLSDQKARIEYVDVWSHTNKYLKIVDEEFDRSFHFLVNEALEPQMIMMESDQK